MTGYYRLMRGWQEHPVFAGEEFSRRDAWCWLIEKAAFKPARVGVGTKIIPIERGQLCYSLRFMAKAWKWDEARVRRFISRLIRENMIACVADAGQTVITICNYDEYQADQSVADAYTAASTTQTRRSGDANKNQVEEVEEDIRVARAPTRPVDVIRAFDVILLDVYGETQTRPHPHNTDHVHAQRFLESGADLDLIVGTIKPIVQRFHTEGQRAPDSLKIFERWIAGAIAARNAPPTEPRHVNGTFNPGRPKQRHTEQSDREAIAKRLFGDSGGTGLDGDTVGSGDVIDGEYRRRD